MVSEDEGLLHLLGGRKWRKEGKDGSPTRQGQIRGVGKERHVPLIGVKDEKEGRVSPLCSCGWGPLQRQAYPCPGSSS